MSDTKIGIAKYKRQTKNIISQYNCRYLGRVLKCLFRWPSKRGRAYWEEESQLLVPAVSLDEAMGFLNLFPSTPITSKANRMITATFVLRR